RKYNEATNPLIEVMKRSEKEVGKDHPNTLASVSNLAGVGAVISGEVQSCKINEPASARGETEGAGERTP
ncbi:uncharacterized protein BDR25DRAFT_220853, partial [Lindgomyces ingoldianus]